MADNWLAQGMFHGAGQPYWGGAKTLVDDFVKFELVGLSIAAAIPVAYAIPYYMARGIGYYYALGGSAAVLGRFPGYLDAARTIGANAFSMPARIFTMLELFGEGWTANEAFIDQVLNSGQRIYLSTYPLGQAGSIYEIELWYLEMRGYVPVMDEYTASLWRMVSR